MVNLNELGENCDRLNLFYYVYAFMVLIELFFLPSCKIGIKVINYVHTIFVLLEFDFWRRRKPLDGKSIKFHDNLCKKLWSNEMRIIV